MIKRHTPPKPLFLILFFLLLNSLLSIGFFIATPDNVIGNDFFDFYTASQAAYKDGISPYSEEVELRNQIGLYGRPAEPGENLMAYNYPPYALFFFYPLAFLPIKWAQSIWISFLISVLLFFPILVFPKIPRWSHFSYLFFYPVSFGVLLGNYAILVFACLIYVIGFLTVSDPSNKSGNILGGVLLALSTIKPQFSAFYLLFIFLLIIHYKRWQVLKYSIFSFIALIIFSFLFLPNWPTEWVHQISRHAHFNDSIPHLTIFLQTFVNNRLSSILSIIILIILFIVFLWILYRWWNKKIEPFLVLVFIGFLTYLIHPRSVSYEQMVFLVPFFIWIFSNPPAIPSHTKVAFWFSGILISWAGFFAARAGWSALFPLEWIFGFYLIWMIYIFLTHSGPPSNAVHLQNHDSTAP